jgi:hypothetical protein
MKKLIILLLLLSVSFGVIAQTPQKMSYQCVIRNASGSLVINHGVGVKVSILQGSASGTVVYQETFNPNPQTNANGLLSLEIGTADPGTLLQVHSNTTYAYGITPIIRISDNFKEWNIGLGDSDDRFAIASDDYKERLTIMSSNGYVGIGTTAPAAGLHIKASTWPGSFIYLESGTGGDAGFRLYEGSAVRWSHCLPKQLKS